MLTTPSNSAAAASFADPLVGQRLGKYRICGILGRGGMGLVYEAEDQTLQRRVAMKLLSSRLANNPEMLGMFLREARAAARLSHPNTVAIHEIDRRDGVVYIVMELIRGGSAADYIKSHGRFSWPEATRIAADVCRALSAAHAAGLIHRDVKPANIMRSHEGVVKLADFGLAKIVEREDSGLRMRPPHVPGSEPHALGTVGEKPDLYCPATYTLTGVSAQTQQTSRYASGTPQYMSPEQCQCEPLDGRSDLYSLGATYYALLTGASPFAGEGSLEDIMLAQVHKPLPDIRRARADLPVGVWAVLARAMAKRPTDRYQTAAAMLADLEGLLRTETAAVGAGVSSGAATVTMSIPAPTFMPTPTPASLTPAETPTATPAAPVGTAWADTLLATRLVQPIKDALNQLSPLASLGLAGGIIGLLLGLWLLAERMRDPYSGYSHNPGYIPPDAAYKGDIPEPASGGSLSQNAPSQNAPSQNALFHVPTTTSTVVESHLGSAKRHEPLVDEKTVFVWQSPNSENRLADGRKCRLTPRGEVTAFGAMRFQNGAFLADDLLAAAITRACRDADAVTVEMVFRPAVPRQTGPARILSLSTDGHTRNFTIAQEQEGIVIRLRTTQSNPNGMVDGKDCVIFRLPMPPRELHLVVSYSPDRLCCWVNGVLQSVDNPFRGRLSNWEERHHLIFGDEYQDARPWRGSIRHVYILARTVTDEEVQRRYAAANPAVR